MKAARRYWTWAVAPGLLLLGGAIGAFAPVREWAGDFENFLEHMNRVKGLLVFVAVSFVAPIVDMLFRSVENQIVSDTLPRTVVALQGWDAAAGAPPDEAVFAALYTDLVIAEEYKLHTRLGTRLNYEFGGMSSLMRATGRDVVKFETGVYAEQFAAADPAFADPAQWAEWMTSASMAGDLATEFPETIRPGRR